MDQGIVCARLAHSENRAAMLVGAAGSSRAVQILVRGFNQLEWPGAVAECGAAKRVDHAEIAAVLVHPERRSNGIASSSGCNAVDRAVGAFQQAGDRIGAGYSTEGANHLITGAVLVDAIGSSRTAGPAVS